MAKQVFDVKEFIAVASQAKNIKIKKNKDCVKFKARGPRTLITLVVKDPKKAQSLMSTLKAFKPEYIK